MQLELDGDHKTKLESSARGNLPNRSGLVYLPTRHVDTVYYRLYDVALLALAKEKC